MKNCVFFVDKWSQLDVEMSVSLQRSPPYPTGLACARDGLSRGPWQSHRRTAAVRERRGASPDWKRRGARPDRDRARPVAFSGYPCTHSAGTWSGRQRLQRSHPRDQGLQHVSVALNPSIAPREPAGIPGAGRRWRRQRSGQQQSLRQKTYVAVGLHRKSERPILHG